MNQYQSIILGLAIVTGSIFGSFFNIEADFIIDFFIILLLFFIFYEVSLKGINLAFKNKKFIGIAWVINFILIPTIAFLIVSLLIDQGSLFFVGLIIYLIAPCTDWVLGFTKLAKGDVDLNSALLPINLISQIILLPIYLYLFVGSTGLPQFNFLFEVLIIWIILPFIAARIFRIFIKLKENTTESLVVGTLFFLVFSIFAININTIISNITGFLWALLTIFIFFIIIYFMVEFIAKKMKFSKKEMIALVMTTSARNAPLMFGISLVLFPEQSIIHTTIIIGMLVEFPHLIILTKILKKD